MRCNKHPSDLSSSVGVCASCLRERLFSLIAAQARQQAAVAAQAEEDRRKSDAHHPPPLIFPRSVSPYICRRSDDSSWSHNHRHHNDRRFYSTPQVGPTFVANGTTTKKKHSKFSLIGTLFRSSRSEQIEPDPRVSKVSKASLASSTASPLSSSSSTSSHSWFSNLISGRRKKQSRFNEIAPPNLSRLHRRTDRGMSPTDQLEDEEEGSPSASGYSSESSGWRKSATATATVAQPGRRRGQNLHTKNVSGMAFCLSPLVRASPNRHRLQKESSLPPSMVFSGDIGRGPSKCHLSSAASFCANRSRKLADFGRYNYNP